MTTCLEKSCSFGLPWVPFVNCCQYMYLVVSLWVLRAGCGIWQYQFLIIAYPFTFPNELICLTPATMRRSVIYWNLDRPFICFILSHLSPLTLEVVGAPQMTLQQYLSILPCLPLPSGSLQTPFPSHLLSSSPSCSFHCPLQNCLRHARGSWDVAIPSEFPFFTMVRRSSCTPIAFWILLQTSSFITWSL